MYISRKVYSGDVLLLGVLLCVVGCASVSKPPLSAKTQAEALSHFSLGLLAADNEDSAAAYDHFQTALRLDPDAETVYAPAVAVSLDLGKKAEALRLAKEQIKRHPDAPAPQLLLAKVYALTGRPDLAEPLFNHLHEVFPNDPDVLNQYIRSALTSPSLITAETGINLLTAFHGKFPGTEASFCCLMLLHAGKKDYAKALEVAREIEALSLKNNSANLLSPSFYYQYASLHERTGERDAAEKLFFRVIESGEQPLTSASQNYIAYMWAERGEKLEQALALIRNALAFSPENDAFIDTLGWIYYMQGRYSEALDELKKACAISGDDPAILEHLGDTYLKLGQPDAALEQWEKAFKIDPESERLIERLKKHRNAD
ncbi:MAG: tetratricopeptide repeat protein [Pontiellaceae bacterium]|jgi:tetratricopeptide (TPR) repeat protein|nr:tetratricopeptide repeat protein [Pontiellaceae bacterium]